MISRPMKWSIPQRGLLILWAVFGVSLSAGFCQSDNPTEAPPLSARQEALTLRYQRFESTLLQLGEYLRKTDPDRAELLLRTLGKSKEGRVADQFNELITLLERGQLGDAIDNQEALHQQMALLLTLLQSEDRVGDLEKEQQRIQALIRDVDKLISKQTDARAATERGSPGKEASDQQKKVADQTQEIIGKIDQQDAQKSGSKSDSQSGETKPASANPSSPDDQPKDPKEKPTESDLKDGTTPPDKDKPPKSADKPAEDQPSPSEQDAGKPSNSGAPKPGQQKPPGEQSPSKNSPSPQQPMPQDSQPESQPGQSPEENSESAPMQDESSSAPGEERTPGREELQRAKQEMERAIKELKQQQKEAASDRQDKALRELLAAKEKLEEILRQLREEEQELLLAALEARFRDMLARQINVHNGTLGLAAIPAEQRTDRQRSRAIELARNQDEIALLAAKALTLLKEEGSSIAFPEAVVQIREDMLTSARRLERGDVDELTQSIQKDIIEALEEMLDALQKEMEKAKDKKQQGEAQQSQQQDPSLVDALSELKMLRSLQYRVNRRTKQLGRLVDGDQAQDAELIQQLRQLSARQAKIFQTADDLAAGRNQ